MLRAVVQVALELSPLGVAGSSEPRPGVGKRADRVLPRRVELGVLKRKQGDGPGRAQELGIVDELLVVDDRDGRASIQIDLRQALIGPGRRQLRAVGVHPFEGARLPEAEPQS